MKPSAKSLHCSLTALALLTLSATAAAVHINPRGEGQALVFPYYTTAAGNETMLTLVNYTPVQKVVQLRVVEGERGRTAAALNVYIDGNDTWTAAILRGANDRPGMVTTDRTCTFPDLYSSSVLDLLPGSNYPFLPFALAADAPGGNGADRLGEGFIEAVELATVRTGTPSYEAVRHNAGGVPDCPQVEAFWRAPAGRWVADPRADFANPTGGLGGDVAVINLARGTAFGLAAVALDEYRTDPLDVPRGTLSSVARHFVADDERGTLLDHALSDPPSGNAVAKVTTDRGLVTLTYPQDRVVDAVSAVFMAAQMQAPYDENPDAQARTTLALTYPTRASYADPALSASTAPLPPFGSLLSGLQPVGTGPGYALTAIDRAGRNHALGQGCIGFPTICQPPLVARLPGTVVELITSGHSPDPLIGTRLHGNFGRQTSSQPEGGLPSSAGWIRMDTTDASNPLQGGPLRSSLEGRRLLGVPVIANRLTTYLNENVTPGVLSNYSLATPVVTRARCAEADGSECR